MLFRVDWMRSSTSIEWQSKWLYSFQSVSFSNEWEKKINAIFLRRWIFSCSFLSVRFSPDKISISYFNISTGMDYFQQEKTNFSYQFSINSIENSFSIWSNKSFEFDWMKYKSGEKKWKNRKLMSVFPFGYENQRWWAFQWSMALRHSYIIAAFISLKRIR